VARRKPSERSKHEVLLKSKRRCPLCFASGKTDPQKGGLVHIEPRSRKGDDDPNNLVYLCLQHHYELDKGSVTAEEVKKARAQLYESMNVDTRQLSSERPWQEYEELVVNLIRSAVSERLNDYFKLLKFPLYTGRSGVSHEVDLSIEFTIAGLRYLTVFEIKYRRDKVGAEDVLQFGAITEDLGANKGAIISNSGFSAAAVQLARAKGFTLVHLPQGAQQLKDGVFEDILQGGLAS
jgi:hypothetical protein